MTNMQRILFQYVCEGDIKKAQQQTRRMLEAINTKTDEAVKNALLKQLDLKESRLIDLPANLKDLLIAEDMTDFPENKFLLREQERAVVNELMAALRVSNRLEEMGISYRPTLMLHGESGTGKTMLARYIAHKAGLPFVYVCFSSLVDSHLGGTQNRIERVFNYARSAPCVLCFDEIDAIAMKRGQEHEVGEMSRIVIALMQEMDRLPNGMIVIGTTNRYDRLDPALVRRFSMKHEVLPMTVQEAKELAHKFFDYAGVSVTPQFFQQMDTNNDKYISAAAIIDTCTKKVVEIIMREESGGEREKEI